MKCLQNRGKIKNSKQKSWHNKRKSQARTFQKCRPMPIGMKDRRSPLRVKEALSSKLMSVQIKILPRKASLFTQPQICQLCPHLHYD